jgi:DNA repair exonuclease SbcCD ATPase subunit
MAVKDLNNVEMREGEFVDKTEAVVPARANEIAMEINIIKRRAAEGLLKDYIEIGRLLCEAKETVPYGAWGTWLSENVGYSTSNANNMMRAYKEQEQAAQLDMFGENGFQMFEGLEPSKVVELLRLPSAERKAFVDSHDVADMSVREIRAEVKEEKRKREEAEAEVDALKGQVVDAKRAAEDAERKAEIAEDARAILSDKLDEANRLLEEAQGRAEISPEERAEIEKAARKAAEDAAKAKIEAAKKKADKELEKARAEGADALKKAQAEQEKVVQAAVDRAKAEAKAEAEKTTAARVAELEAQLREQAALASPYRVRFGEALEGLKAAYGRMVAVCEEAEREEPDEGAILRGILGQVVGMLG